MVQLKNQLPKTKRLRGKASTTVLDKPLAQGVIPHCSTKPSRALPCAVREESCDDETDVMFQREGVGPVVPKKRA